MFVAHHSMLVGCLFFINILGNIKIFVNITNPRLSPGLTVKALDFLYAAQSGIGLFEVHKLQKGSVSAAASTTKGQFPSSLLLNFP